MNKRTTTIRWAALALTLLSVPAFAVDVRICTSRGAIDLELDELRAPRHTANFLDYASSGFYTGTIFHRAVRGSMLQGGSFTRALDRRPGGNPVINESSNGLSNRRGTIAAARSEDPDSANSQFFFNLSDNMHLDASPGVPGYTVFGRVTAGMELLDQIASQPTRRVGELSEVPSPIVAIESVATIDRASVFGLSIQPDPAALREELAEAQARGDSRAILNAIDDLNQSCVPLTAAERIAEAEAADTLGMTDRARYVAEDYLSTAGPRDGNRAVAERLLSGLPAPVRARTMDELIGHCQRPIAPNIPSDGRFTNLPTLQATETSVQRYLDLGERYLSCVANTLSATELSHAETRAVTEQYNDIVIEMTGVSARFNRVVSDFRTGRTDSTPQRFNGNNAAR